MESKPVLITYATWSGSTAEVAEYLAKSFAQAGIPVVLQPMKAVKTVNEFSAVILGTAVRIGKIHRDASKFVRRHQRELGDLPTACFVVCMTAKDPTPENQTTTAGYLDQLGGSLKPQSKIAFAGVWRASAFPFPLNRILRASQMEEGDYRNWEVISAWGDEIAARLSQTAR